MAFQRYAFLAAAVSQAGVHMHMLHDMHCSEWLTSVFPRPCFAQHSTACHDSTLLSCVLLVPLLLRSSVF
jgi:hypothetical protein